MATASTLTVKVTADVANFARDMTRATREVNQFALRARDISMSLATFSATATTAALGLRGFADTLPASAAGARQLVASLSGVATAVANTTAVVSTLTMASGQLTKAFAVLRSAAALGAATLGPYVALAAAIGAVAVAIYQSGESARRAKKGVEEYKKSIADFGLSDLQRQQTLLQAQFDAVTASLTRARQAAASMPTVSFGVGGGGAMSLVQHARQLRELEAQQHAIAERMNVSGQLAAKLLGTPAEQAKRAFDALASRVHVIVSGFSQMRSGAQPIVGITQAWADAQREVEALVARTGNGITDAASKARDLIVQLHSVDPLLRVLASGTLPSVGITPSGTDEKRRLSPIDTTPPKLDLGPKIDKTSLAIGDLKYATTEGLKRLIDAVTTILPQQLALIIGGRTTAGQIGSALGGAFGSGVGSGTALRLFGAITAESSIGAIAGTAVLGVAGSIAGAWLGSKIGDLFGRPRRQSDALAQSFNTLGRTVDQITESISNIPTGFKAAYYRFAAADPAEEAFRPRDSRARAYIYINELKVAAANAQEFIDSLSKAAEQSAARGGMSGLSYATAAAVGGRGY